MELNRAFFELLKPTPDPKDYKYVVKLDSSGKSTFMGSDDIEEVKNWVSDIMTEHQMHPKQNKVYFPIGDRFEKGEVVLTLNFEL